MTAANHPVTFEIDKITGDLYEVDPRKEAEAVPAKQEPKPKAEAPAAPGKPKAEAPAAPGKAKAEAPAAPGKAKAEKPAPAVPEAPPEALADARKQEIEQRREQGEAQIREFVDKQLPQEDPNGQPLPDFEASSSDENESMSVQLRRKMADNWGKVEEKIDALKARESNFTEIARDHVWNVYIRQNKPETVKDMVQTYLMATHSFDAVKNKIDSGQYFRYFFNKVGHLLVSILDEHKNTFPHYILASIRSDPEHVINCIEALTEGAKMRARAHSQGEQDKSDDRERVKEFFTSHQNEAGETILGLVEKQHPPSVAKRCRELIDGMFWDEGEKATESLSKGDKDGITAVRDAVGKPFDPNLLMELVNAGDKQAVAGYIRIYSDEIDPLEVDQVYEAKGIDLFAVDILQAPDDSLKPLGQKIAASPGALANAFSKRGSFDIECARRKLVKEDGKRLQGRRDHRGYTNYMQIAATRNVNHSFLQNEHEFWDHILHQVAKYNYMNNNPHKLTLREIQIKTNRDILDMPGDDGRTALHLAAISGNDEVMHFILSHILDFTWADELRTARGRNANPAQLRELQKKSIQEMRTNLSYLMGADNKNYNAWMHAIVKDNKNILMTLVGVLERVPEYLEVISLLPIQPPGEERATTLYEFASRAFGGKSGVNEAGRFARTILREAEQRAKARRETRRGPSSGKSLF